MLIVFRVIDEYVLSVEISWTLNQVIFEVLMVEISPVFPGAYRSVNSPAPLQLILHFKYFSSLIDLLFLPWPRNVFF